MIRPAFSRLKSSLAGTHIPMTLREFRAARRGPRVLSNSIPKAGTHLTERILKLNPSMVSRWKKELPFSSSNNFKSELRCINGQYVSSHLYWTADISSFLIKNNMKVIFTVRDIRDVAVSRAHYHTHMLKTHKSYDEFRSLKSDAERLSLSIIGNMELYLHGLSVMFQGYSAWLNDPNCLVVKFEDLIGPAGGGSEAKQFETTRAILEFVGTEVDDATVKKIADNLYSSNAKTFRRGVLGSWQEEFNEDHKEQFKREANDFLIALGYETNDSW